MQAAPGAITEVLDPLGTGETVLRYTVDDGDVAPITPTENPRAQLLTPDMFNPGDELWLKTKFLVPADFPTVDGWMTLLSLYGSPFNGPSPWHVEIVGDDLHWTRNSTYGFDVPWQMPLPKGVWVTVLLHERFATDGFVELWIDGQQVTFFAGGTHNPSGHLPTTKLEMQTVDRSNNGGPNSVRVAQYRKVGMFETATIYYGKLLIGSTRAAVEG